MFVCTCGAHELSKWTLPVAAVESFSMCCMSCCAAEMPGSNAASAGINVQYHRKTRVPDRCGRMNLKNLDALVGAPDFCIGSTKVDGIIRRSIHSLARWLQAPDMSTRRAVRTSLTDAVEVGAGVQSSQRVLDTSHPTSQCRST